MTTENTERGELAQDLWQAATGKTTNRPEWAFVEAYVDDLAGAILAAGYSRPKQVTTVAELDALPVGSVVRLLNGAENVNAALKTSKDEWGLAGIKAPMTTATLFRCAVERDGFTVLYSPVVSGE